MHNAFTFLEEAAAVEGRLTRRALYGTVYKGAAGNGNTRAGTQARPEDPGSDPGRTRVHGAG